MLKAKWEKKIFVFKKPAGTSRGVLKEKKSYFITVTDTQTSTQGIGECSILPNLSIDDCNGYEEMLDYVCANCDNFEELLPELQSWPSIIFGMETAILDCNTAGKNILFPSFFTRGIKPIPINGLVWMGDEGFMKSQIQEKINAGYHCIKLKIGALDFNKEIKLLETIRASYSKSQIELRVDANGAFSPEDALKKLSLLADLDIHSIEQPIAPKQWYEMHRLCEKNILPIALDEELIGVFKREDKKILLNTIQPQYIILKPSFIGGFALADEWIELAEERKIGWWATSALESNIGLMAIAQWVANKKILLPQGLGTGALFTSNFPTPLHIRNGELCFRQ